MPGLSWSRSRKQRPPGTTRPFASPWVSSASRTRLQGEPAETPNFRLRLYSLLADLKTMSERLKSRYYTTRKLFMADMQRIFTNCREYNPPESEYYKCANLLEKFFYTKIKEAGLIEK